MKAASEEATRNELAQRISKQAQGNFLYAKLVIDDNIKPADEKKPTIPDLPKDLSEYYHRFLLREVGKNEERWFAAYKPSMMSAW